MSVSVYTEAGTDLIVDVSGYMTGSTEPPSTSGLYVALAPARLLDTRSAAPFSNGQPIGSGTTIGLPIAARGGVPNAGVLAVAVNVTATRTLGYGYITGWPANTPIPATSSLNFVSAGRTVANHAITALNGGAVNFYSFGGADLLVDLMGYWTDHTSVGIAPHCRQHVEHDQPPADDDRRHPRRRASGRTRSCTTGQAARTGGGIRAGRSSTWSTATAPTRRWSTSSTWRSPRSRWPRASTSSTAG